MIVDTSSWTYTETWVAEDAVLATARAQATEVGVRPVTPGAGAALRLLAALTAARAVVEVGTGVGVSGLHLLRGMPAAGVLTSIDTEAELLRLARGTFAEAGVAPGRLRLITGAGEEVLPRLTDAGYDLVHLDAAPAALAELVGEAVRLLRPGGALAISAALWRGQVPAPAVRDAETLAVRAALAAVRAEARLVPALLPVGDGLLVAARMES